MRCVVVSSTTLLLKSTWFQWSQRHILAEWALKTETATRPSPISAPNRLPNKTDHHAIYLSIPPTYNSNITRFLHLKPLHLLPLIGGYRYGVLSNVLYKACLQRVCHGKQTPHLEDTYQASQEASLCSGGYIGGDSRHMAAY